jgi:signal transduction histidine kinase
VRLFGSMRVKILLLLVVTGLLPLVVVSVLFYISARQLIVSDRVEIYLNHLSQQTADKLDLFLTERREEGLAMASNEVVESFLTQPPGPPPPTVMTILNEYVQIQEVYDLMVLVDPAGRIRAVNGINRFGDWFDARLLNQVLLGNIRDYPEEAACWERSLGGGTAVHDFYRSSLVHKLYYFEDDDSSRSYHLLFAQPVIDHRTGATVGVWLNIMNWEYVQAILDLVQSDFRKYGLPSGSALLVDRTGDRILASPVRRHHRPGSAVDYIGLSMAHTRAFADLRQALQKGGHTICYRMNGETRYGGVSRVGQRDFGWRVLVSLSEEDIFRPANRLRLVLCLIILAAALMVPAGAWLLSRQLIRPLQGLTASARDIARGSYSRRVQAHGGDEIGSLAEAFNTMAATIEERQRDLEQINRDLEAKVSQRTGALETSNRELRQALEDLREAQDHLVQSEKMASLGRLVAGIAHEIKNPLNFIYGNTSFLNDYIARIRRYVEQAEKAPAGGTGGLEELRRLRQAENLDFVLDDLGKLAANIHEGASRIKAIVEDLRAFSRAPSGSWEDVDLRKVLDMCLNLLRNQYKNRIRIHRDYGDIPPVKVQLGKMEQVFLNLLTNAIEASGDEGDIWVRTRRVDRLVTVEVEDTGSGIPAAHLQKIFEPFFTTKEVGMGTGLGLSISYSIVEQHQGKLRAANRPGGGAVFRVELPIEPSIPPGGDV